MMMLKIKKAPDILLTIDIATEDSAWDEPDFNLQELLGEACHAAIENSDVFPDIKDKTGEISVVLCSDDFIQKLNKEYRNKDKPTNVLSFPQIAFYEEIPEENTLIIGDIILAYGTITREATAQKKSFKDHLTHLLVHGTLHLLGYDHEDDTDAEEMEALEITILKQINVENPYSELNFMA